MYIAEMYGQLETTTYHGMNILLWIKSLMWLKITAACGFPSKTFAFSRHSLSLFRKSGGGSVGDDNSTIGALDSFKMFMFTCLRTLINGWIK